MGTVASGVMAGAGPMGVKLAVRRLCFSPSWCAEAHHPRRAVPIAAKAWMPTFVGMTRDNAIAAALF